MRIDNSILQAGALIGVSGLGMYAAYAGQWQLVGACVTGLFAIINIHPKSATSGDN